jgi:ferrous iron transport protein B
MNAPLTPPRTLTVALVGNPNTGKSTLFNALTGLRQHVGNYPGVTVEMKTGTARLGDTVFEIVDLPGTYSLAPRSPDEMVSVDLLLGQVKGAARPDVIVSIIDATNIERHLYLTSQVMELGTPVVVAVNMVDVAAKQGIVVDFAQLSTALKLPVVPVQANRQVGLEELQIEIAKAASTQEQPTVLEFPPRFQEEVSRIREQLGSSVEPFLASRLLLDVGGHTEKLLTQRYGHQVPILVAAGRQKLAESGFAVPGVEAKTRYTWIRQTASSAIKRPTVRPVTLSDRLDRVFTHKIWGSLIFLVLMFLIFQSIYVAAKPIMDVVTGSIEWLSDTLCNHLDHGPLRSLLADGVFGGVGGVLVFLPQIMILFAVIAVLEDCGYMARAAFLMDKIMAKCGLNGKSFIPLLSSVACAIPGVMATRVIENRRDRLATILVAPLMSCSARLPLYLLLIGVFLSDPWWLPGLALFGMYLIGLIVAPLVALLLKRTLLRGETPVFVMEMPAFKIPQLTSVLRRMIDAGWAFTRRAGTIILASMIVVWALLYFPSNNEHGKSYDVVTAEIKEQIEDLDKEIEAAEEASKKELEEKKEALQHEHDTLFGDWKRQSYLGQAGHFLEPTFRPLGWDWKIGMAALASFPAREVVVGTLGIIYNQGDVDAGDIADSDKPGDTPLGQAIRTEWESNPLTGKYSVVVALSLLVFFALCCQCASTLAVIKRETRSWSWTIFTFVYMTALAYVGALLTFQIGRLIVG